MIRISLVHYLNAAPLGWSFLRGPLKGHFDIIPSSRARCAELLACGEAEIGIIPSIEYRRIPDPKVILGIAIASVTRVRSVLTIRRRATRQIRSIALDSNSRTFVTQFKLLLCSKSGLTPEFVNHSPDLDKRLRKCDAALKISPAEIAVSDLAEAQVTWQERPFVFAMWVCRPDAGLPKDLVAILQKAKDWGCKVRGEIAAEFASKLGLPHQFLEDYLPNNVEYEMSERHIEGLERFYRLAYEAKLIPESKPLQFL